MDKYPFCADNFKLKKFGLALPLFFRLIKCCFILLLPFTISDYSNVWLYYGGNECIKDYLSFDEDVDYNKKCSAFL